MPETQHFRIVTYDGRLSKETFLIAPGQPKTIRTDCVLVIDSGTGNLMTVHRTRLVPAETVGKLVLEGSSRSICLECGKVKGVVEDQVACPHHNCFPCSLLEPHSERLPAPHEPGEKPP